MPFKAPVDTLLSIGGRNLTGMGMLLEIAEQPFAAKVEDLDLIGAPYIYSTKTGKRGYGFSVSGFVRKDQGSITRLHEGDASARPESVIYARYGNLPGAHADLIPAVIPSGGAVDLPKDGLIKVNSLSYQLAGSGQGGVLIDGTLIANQLAISDNAAPYLNMRHDFGESRDGPWTAITHVEIVEWDGATELDVDLMSATPAVPPGDGRSWSRATVNGDFNFTPASGRYQDAVVAKTSDLGRWNAVRVRWTGGTRPQARIIMALYRPA